MAKSKPNKNDPFKALVESIKKWNALSDEEKFASRLDDLGLKVEEISVAEVIKGKAKEVKKKFITVK